MSVDRGLIDVQLRQIGESDRWWDLPEFRELPRVLDRDESLAALAVGRVRATRLARPLSGRGWLLVVTDQRLIMLKQEKLARRQLDVGAGQIISIRHAGRLGSAHFHIRTSNGSYRLKLRSADASRFFSALEPLIPTRTPGQLPAELAPLAWLPGIDRVVGLPGVAVVVSRIAALSPSTLEPVDRVQQLEATVERLQEDVARLQQQVGFLEDLLDQRGRDGLPSRTGAELAPQGREHVG